MLLPVLLGDSVVVDVICPYTQSVHVCESRHTIIFSPEFIKTDRCLESSLGYVLGLVIEGFVEDDLNHLIPSKAG